MSVVIIMGKHKKAVVWSATNIFAETIGDENDADCFEKITARANDFQEDLPSISAAKKSPVWSAGKIMVP